MKCNRVLPLLDDLAAGSLTLPDETAVRKHLDACPSCLAAYDQAQAFLADLNAALEMEMPLPATLDGSLGERLLDQLPDIPGREDPLLGTGWAQHRARHGASLWFLGSALVLGIWLLATQVIPDWLGRSLLLAAGAVGRGVLASASEIAFAFALTLKGAGMVLQDVDPAAVGLTALALAMGALALALRSPGSRWEQ